MSPRASRFFGCVLPVALALFGCGSCLLLGYAGQVFFALVPVTDEAMAPYLASGDRVLSDNTAFWEDPPGRNRLASLEAPDGVAVRYVIAGPGDTVEGRGGRVYVNDQPCDGERRDDAGQACGLELIWQGPGVDDFVPLTLPADGFWVMGTSKEAPDSRIWGAIARERFFGQVLLRVGDGLRLEAVDLPETAPAERSAPGKSP
ncbi:MAG: signal peptidase I [Anaerolineae bacterium]|nr:signal peptidase I [Ardenticatenia bacterium]HQZ70044.1 signal peptidase I [Anaerolineae bacterium]HRA18966.1 signal peptidase I [Anaerolineae bacterium]